MGASKSKRIVSGKGKEVIVAPSILSADLGCLASEVKAVDKAGADWIHIDVMDGRFVPNITWGMPIVKAARKMSDKVLDVHLMIVEPEKFIDDFAAAGADMIVVHAEACPHLHRSVQQIKAAGKKLKPKREIMAGVALNPSTSLAALDYVLPDLDMVLIMSVNPGFGGQSFIPQSIDKLYDLKWLIADMGLEMDIQIDGGVTPDNVATVAEAGANVFVAGSAVFHSKNYKQTITALRKNAKQARE